MFRLTDVEQEELIHRPESGMGYQWVDARLTKGQSKETLRAVVLNCELLLFEQELEELRQRALVETYEQVLRSLEVNQQWNLYLPKRFDDFPVEAVAEPETQNQTPNQRFSSPYEGLKRYSAYSRDKRVSRRLLGGNTYALGLVAGTYVTSANDSRLVPSGFAAVGRYALPNPWPASYVVTAALAPVHALRMRTGTVQPAFQQSGGGVECLLLDPTDPGTVCGPYRIPEV